VLQVHIARYQRFSSLDEDDDDEQEDEQQRITLDLDRGEVPLL
jgi:hypothetical protein